MRTLPTILPIDDNTLAVAVAASVIIGVIALVVLTK